MEPICNILEDLGTLSVSGKGYKKKLVKASWYGKQPSYEIRNFDSEDSPLKRAGMTVEELRELKGILNEMDF